jgi:hypothetical protein
MTACDDECTEAPTKLNSMTRERVAEMMRELEPIDDLATEIRPHDMAISSISRVALRSDSVAPRLPAQSDAPEPLIARRRRPATREIEIAIGLSAFLVILIPSLYLLFR